MNEEPHRCTECRLDVCRVLAKSDGKALFDHIEDCLRVYADMCRALPAILVILGDPEFFDLLFCSVYFHDWGKAHREFQKVLRGEKNAWAHGRHEVYSVPFVEMLPFSPEQKRLICQAILGHHKDFEALWQYLYSDDEIKEYRLNNRSQVNPLDFRENLHRKMDVGYLVELKNRLQNCYDKFSQGTRRFDFVRADFSSRINPIKEYVKPVLQNAAEPSAKLYWRQMLLLGATRLCDHMGSAESLEIPRLAPTNFAFLDKLDDHLFSHQVKCGETSENVFLTAPTGSGKTESALKWLRRQVESGHQGRIFYVLPYTASINAMHQRLIKCFEPENKPGNTRYIGLLHGKLSQYLAEYFERLTDDPRESQSRLRKLKELHRQMVHPLKVVTPFQILKYCYGVKGFEMGFTELAGAMLIFDEIHAYDMQTFAQIISSLRWLSEHLHIRAMIMTATLPSFMLEELKGAIGASASVRADVQLLDEFTRHRVHVLGGPIFQQIPLIEKYLGKGCSVLVVCNTVANAQAMFVKLESGVEKGEAVLLHSRFIVKDRLEKERLLGGENVRLLIGTQAIEVSLDIDFDVLFTEPAPLDAMIQRFGRINRKRGKGICPVFICSEGGAHDSYIYPREVVDSSLNVLRRIDVIKEREVQAMLDQVYPDWADGAKYEETKQGFLAGLNRLKPFMTHKEDEQDFYRRFTGVSLLPICFEADYEDYLSNLQFIEAEKLLVSVHQGMFHRFLKEGLVEKHAAVVDGEKCLKQLPYWVVGCRYDKELGLLEERSPDTATTISF